MARSYVLQIPVSKELKAWLDARGLNMDRPRADVARRILDAERKRDVKRAALVPETRSFR